MFNKSRTPTSKYNSKPNDNPAPFPSKGAHTSSGSHGRERNDSQRQAPKFGQQQASGSKASEQNGMDLRIRHPFTAQAESVLDAISPRYAAQMLSELGNITKRTSSTPCVAGEPQDPETLSQMASDISRAMPRYRAAHMAQIAEKYQQMNFFDAAVFERISFEIKLGGTDLNLQAKDVVQILKAAAHLRADASMDSGRLAEFAAPLIEAMNHLLPRSISQQTKWPISMDELVDCATALSILSPSDAGKFAQFAMIRCGNNPSPTAVTELLPVLLASGEKNFESMITKCLSAKKLTKEQNAALKVISEELGTMEFQCEVGESKRVLPSGVPVAGALKITDPISKIVHEIDLDTTSQKPCYVSNVKGFMMPSGKDVLRSRAFEDPARVAALAPVSNTSPSPLVLNLSAQLIAALAAEPTSIERKRAVDEVMDTLTELFTRNEQSIEVKASA